MALVSPAMCHSCSFFSSPDWQRYLYIILLTTAPTVLLIQATSGATLRWPIAIDNVLDAISNLKTDHWSTFPKRPWFSKPFHFRLHSVYTIVCRHCLLQVSAADFSVSIVYPGIFDRASIWIMHDMADVFCIPCPKIGLPMCVVHTTCRSSLVGHDEEPLWSSAQSHHPACLPRSLYVNN